MLIVNRTIIRNLAANDVAYARGLQLFRNKDVKSASYSKAADQYKLVVHDLFDYTVLIKPKEDQTFDFTCNCPSNLKERGACRHVVASLFRIMKHQEVKNRTDITPEEMRPLKVLDYYSSRDDDLISKEVYRVEPVITVSQILGDDGVFASLSLRVGNTRLYKVQALKRFIAEYIDGQNIILGKDFKYIAEECEFDRSSRDILDFLISIYEVCELSDSQRSSKVFSKSQILLTHRMLIRLLKILGKNTFELCLYDRTYERVKAFRANPNIRYDLDVVEDAVVLDYRDKDAVIPLSKSGDLIYYNGAVFMPDARFKRNYA
ncbi:MAG: hypothetical protein ILP10_00915, partial [Lachnospiraceae bacterium]|nr:hypothetical protein [Lachnospiraceae bacterium]